MLRLHHPVWHRSRRTRLRWRPTQCVANRRHCYLRQTRPRRAALLPLLRHSANRTLLEVAFEPGDVYSDEEVRPLLGGARLSRFVFATVSEPRTVTLVWLPPSTACRAVVDGAGRQRSRHPELPKPKPGIDGIRLNGNTACIALAETRRLEPNEL